MKFNQSVMDKNTITGFILIALVVIGFSYFGQPSKEEINQSRINDSIAAANTQKEKIEKTIEDKKAQEKIIAEAQDTTTLFGTAKNGKGQSIILQNKLVKVTISTKGGNIIAAELKNYKNQEKKNVELFNAQTAHLNLTLPLKTENINFQDYVFTPQYANDSVASLVVSNHNGSSLRIDYKLLENTYMVNCSISTKGMANLFVPNHT